MYRTLHNKRYLTHDLIAKFH